MGSYPGFLGPASKGQSYMAGDEILRNWYLEKNESPTAPNPWAMVPCPGFSSLGSVAESPGRARFYQNGRAFFIAGGVLYEMLSDFSTTNRGVVATDANPATISANGDAGNQLWITSGGVGYNYDLTTNALTVQGVAGTTVTMGGYLEGRFLYLDATSGAFYASALYDGTSWPGALAFQSTSGDPWRALVVTPDDLIRLLGENSGEAWAPNPNSTTLPFQKVPEASIAYGIVAPFAWSVDETITWMAQNKQGRGIAVRAQGYQPVEITTSAIETTIQGYADISDAFAWAYQENGHRFTVFTFPMADQTWVYDGKSGLWHERSYWNTATGTDQAYRPNGVMEAFGKLIVTDRLTGDLYEMKSSFYSDVDGSVIRRVKQPSRLSANQKRIFVENIQLVMDVGVGLVSGQGVDPLMMLQLSGNGGKTFGNERTSSAGPIGEYDTRVQWPRCGSGRNIVPRFVATDPVPWRIVDCLIDYTVGAN